MKKILFTTIIIFCFAETYGQTLKPFKEGDRVAFVGNSITEAGFYENYIWLYYMTRFPERRIEIINVGIGGDVSRQINDRLEADAFAKEPTVVVLTFGMNDSGYFEYNGNNVEAFANEKVAESYKHFQSIISKLKTRSDIEKIIMSSSPYDETLKNKNNYFPGKSKTMERIVKFQKEEAEKNKWAFVDLYYPMQVINQKGQQTNPEFTITGPDRIHPGNGGHLVMAYLFLKAQGLASPVADISIDAKKQSAVNQTNAEVQNVKSSGKELSFDYLAHSLPFPVDTVSRMWGNEQKQSLALEVVPFTEDFNREMLKVKNLQKDKNYSLIIDNDTLGIWPAAAFEKGINLAVLRNAPQYKQAWTIMNMANTVRDIDNKLREYYWMQFNLFNDKGMLFQDDQEAVEAARKFAKENIFVKSKMDTYETLRFQNIRQTYENQKKIIVDEIYKINKPIARKVKVVLTE